MRDRSQYELLLTLLETEQYAACRIAVEKLIDQELESEQPDDRTLAQQHLVLSRALRRLREGRRAAEAADTAAFLARKVKDRDLLAEALFRSGVGYGEAGDYSRAVERLTRALELGEHEFTGRGLYNRGLFSELMGAYSHAAQDYRAALKHARQGREPWLPACCLNLAWTLILAKELCEAEEVLSELELHLLATESRSSQLQVAHHRAHMRYLREQHADAIRDTVAVIAEAGVKYPAVRSAALLTMAQLAAEAGGLQEAYTFGVLSKRLAGKAQRPDLDGEASRQIRQLQLETGSDYMVEALLSLQQVLPGAALRGRGQRPQKRGGGAA